MRPAAKSPFVCAECLWALKQPASRLQPLRYLTYTRPLPLHGTTTHNDDPKPASAREHEDLDRAEEEAEQGAFSRRLAAMSEEMLESSPRAAQKSIEAAGFDEDLKNRLLERIASADFKSQNAGAMSTLNMPSAAGKGTRDQAAARAWDGNETLEDAALRMLDDAHKRIRTVPKIPSPVRTPKRVDAGRPGPGAPGTGTRLANARDRTSKYAFMKDESLSAEERENMRRQLKERFTPSARGAVPATLQGLASLAEQRIDDAIARGQFKNLPRGRPIERDHNMSSPFLDTTEYFMNKIIQKQQIVPPWIEKQQELVTEAARFRGRLRNDWLRYVARTISSGGGSLETQVRRAEEYARAEAVVNPSTRKQESVTSVDDDGRMSQITLQGELKTPPTAAESNPEAPRQDPTATITITSQPLDPSSSSPSSTSQTTTTTTTIPTPPPPASSSNLSPSPTTLTPFRSPAYTAAEASYHAAAVAALNSLTRTYNLMAPNSAKKPYFALERELRAMYADVAPLVAGEIRARAVQSAQRRRDDAAVFRPPAILDNLGGGSARVFDDRRKPYGFKEFWRDLFAKE